MHFQVKIPENGGNNIFTDKKATKKVPLKFLDVKMLAES